MEDAPYFLNSRGRPHQLIRKGEDLFALPFHGSAVASIIYRHGRYGIMSTGVSHDIALDSQTFGCCLSLDDFPENVQIVPGDSLYVDGIRLVFHAPKKQGP